jgi:hypothetical protein
MAVGGDGRRWQGRDDGRGVTGGGGGKERSCVASFEPTLPDLARRGPRSEDGDIKQQRRVLRNAVVAQLVRALLNLFLRSWVQFLPVAFFFSLYIYK